MVYLKVEINSILTKFIKNFFRPTLDKKTIRKIIKHCLVAPLLDNKFLFFHTVNNSDFKIGRWLIGRYNINNELSAICIFPPDHLLNFENVHENSYYIIYNKNTSEPVNVGQVIKYSFEISFLRFPLRIFTFGKFKKIFYIQNWKIALLYDNGGKLIFHTKQPEDELNCISFIGKGILLC